MNYKELVNCFLETGDDLKGIKLFTAYFQHDPQKKSRHKKLNMVQKDFGVDVILGRFRDVEKKCRLCNRKYWIPEEKRTDVNIASYMIKLAVKNEYEKAILITGDSDLIPAVEAVKEVNPNIKIINVVPIGRKAVALGRRVDKIIEMKKKHLAKAHMLPQVTLSDGKTIINCPEEWL